MSARLLIIPSWYPRPNDKINGSFFQEQARLVSDQFDVKVLFFRFFGRPSIRSFTTSPLKTARAWLGFIFQRRSRTKLPEDEVFTIPPLTEYSARVFGLTVRRRYNKRLDLYAQALDELIKNGWKPDLIHAHSVNLGGLAAHRIKEVYGIPYVITEHMPFALSNYPECMRDDIKKAFKSADRVLSLSYDKVRQLAMSDIDVEPNLIFNLVDETMFTKVTDTYVAGEPLRLISIGAASHYKDHRTLLRAMVLLKARGVPFALTLIGLKAWGGLYDETVEFVRSHDLANEVAIIDRIERAEVPDYLAAHHVFVMTSIQEGFPVSVLEALATGLYVVATRHGGTEDILTAEMGSLVEIKNFEKVADRLQEIYLGKIAFDPTVIRRSVVAVCGRDAFKQRLIGYYEQAMAKVA